MADRFGDARPLDLHVVIEAECPGGSFSVAKTSLSDHTASFDEPGPIGSDKAITPVQGWLGAVLGSTNVILRKCAGRHGVGIAALSLTLEADIDRRGMAMEEEVELPFRAVTMSLAEYRRRLAAELSRLSIDHFPKGKRRRSWRTIGTLLPG